MHFIKKAGQLGSVLFVLAGSLHAGSLEQEFLNPPLEYRPSCFWGWIGGHITKEGIAADLDSMKNSGMSGGLIFDLSLYIPEGGIPYGSEEWYDLMDYAVEAGADKGLEIGLQNCPGWATSGGPWVDPEHSMKRVVFSETTADSSSGAVVLPQPKSRENFYRDIAVLAVPESEGSPDERTPEIELLTLGDRKSIRRFFPAENPFSDSSSAVRIEDILDLTGSLKENGELDWTPPKGTWTVLRFGYTGTGTKNHPAREGGEGLEVDKMDARAVRDHFENSLGAILRKADGRVSSVLVDSWEAGQQNWTAEFSEKFSERNGYDLIPFLPVLTGRVVESPLDTQCFLRDFRRTITDLVAENYFGVMREEANRYGAELINEPYPGFAFDEFKAADQVDVVAGEFWVGGISLQTLKRTGSMVETMKADKQLGAEAFTATPDNGRWQATPRSLKPEADAAFVQGLNWVVFHSLIHQPRDDMRPGFTHGRYGTEFGRHNTWWPWAKPFNDYLSRTGVLLRQGNRVADFLYMKNDGPFSDDRFPPVPAGHDFLYIAPFTLLASHVEDGMVVTPGGGRHPVLVVPKLWAADLPMLEKLIELKNGGVLLLGPAPVMPAGRKDLKQIDAWKHGCAQLWPSAAKGYPTTRETANAAKEIGFGPDFKTEPSDSGLEYAHRRSGDRDIYFIRNPKDQAVKANVTFRVSGKGLELWNPIDGSVSSAAIAESTDQGSVVQIELPAFGSTFAVFSGNVQEHVPAKPESPELRQSLELSSWSVTFKPVIGNDFKRKFPELSLWNESDDEAVKYFSGPATYISEFELPEHRGPVVLDIGEVYDLAEVAVNGTGAGVCWTKPNRIDITDLVQSGKNRLEITVVNRWINRLIGDEFLPEESQYKGIARSDSATAGVLSAFPEWYTNRYLSHKRSTFASWRHYSDQSSLVPSGLSGPVQVFFLTSGKEAE